MAEAEQVLRRAYRRPASQSIEMIDPRALLTLESLDLDPLRDRGDVTEAYAPGVARIYWTSGGAARSASLR